VKRASQRNVKCQECGCNIPLYVGPKEPALCRDCGNDTCAATSARGVQHGNWENDPSGASGSWDGAVKAYEQ